MTYLERSVGIGPPCKMKEVLWIDPIQTEPGLIAYECSSCSYVMSVLTPAGDSKER